MTKDKEQSSFDRESPEQPGDRPSKNPALKVFLEFWLLIGLLAAFNLYAYFSGASRMFLVVGIICVIAFLAWAASYVFYFRRS